jgi:hypothetical protein
MSALRIRAHPVDVRMYGIAMIRMGNSTNGGYKFINLALHSSPGRSIAYSIGWNSKTIIYSSIYSTSNVSRLAAPRNLGFVICGAFLILLKLSLEECQHAVWWGFVPTHIVSMNRIREQFPSVSSQ